MIRSDLAQIGLDVTVSAFDSGDIFGDRWGTGGELGDPNAAVGHGHPRMVGRLRGPGELLRPA